MARIWKHSLKLYNNVQLSTAFDGKDLTSIKSSLNVLSSYTDDIKKWVHANFVKLNDNKTDFFATAP